MNLREKIEIVVLERTGAGAIEAENARKDIMKLFENIQIRIPKVCSDGCPFASFNLHSFRCALTGYEDRTNCPGPGNFLIARATRR